MFLMVGLPGAGKTTRVKELAAANRALRLTPDEWMILLFGDSMANGNRFVLEGRLITVALQALRLGTSVVLDYGLWGRDERSALRMAIGLAGSSAPCTQGGCTRGEPPDARAERRVGRSMAAGSAIPVRIMWRVFVCESLSCRGC
jgi:predicted kinase